MAQPKWDATQLAVLDAAVTCAEQVGFGAMTTRRVAELAGVNLSLIHISEPTRLIIRSRMPSSG